jgi:hypothetical protein
MGSTDRLSAIGTAGQVRMCVTLSCDLEVKAVCICRSRVCSDIMIFHPDNTDNHCIFSLDGVSRLNQVFLVHSLLVLEVHFTTLTRKHNKPKSNDQRSDTAMVDISNRY